MTVQQKYRATLVEFINEIHQAIYWVSYKVH